MTNKELAKMLNVSEATFSLIINNRPGISEKTRSRVINELNALGYGSLIKSASSVKTKTEFNQSAKNIGFIVYKKHGEVVSDSPFFLLLLENIDRYVHSCGYNLLVRMISANSDIEQQIEDLNGANLSGIIIFATEMIAEDMLYFKSFSKSIVILDNDFTHLDYDSVVINNNLGTHQAIKYLFNLGHRKIGYLQSKTLINSFIERGMGYKQAMKTFGLELDKKHHFKLSYAEDKSYQEFCEIIENTNEYPTAFVSDDDTITFGAIRAVREKAPHLLDQISFMGFNDRPICELSVPKITSIVVPKDTFGVITARTLIERLEDLTHLNIHDFNKVSVGVHLVVRESTKAPL